MKWYFYVFGALFLSLICIWLAGGFMGGHSVGGGKSGVTAPDFAKAGEPIVIKLDNVVWGAGSRIQGRYKDIRLFYRLVGQSNYKVVPAHFVSTTDDKFEEYDFSIPAFTDGTIGEIEYYFEMQFDGIMKHVGVSKNIRLGH